MLIEGKKAFPQFNILKSQKRMLTFTVTFDRLNKLKIW